MIYNGYLSLDERCAISDVKKSYADAERLNMLYEAVELDYRINCLYAESKVLDTYGTYDDLEKMYTEASEQTSEKKLTILQRLVGFIESLFNRIKEFFLKKFKKEGDIEAPKDTEPAIKTLTDLWASLKGVVTQPSIESVLAVKDTVINLIDNHKKEFVAFNLAGAGAGAGLVVWKAAKKKAAADKLLETSNDVSKSMGKVKEFIRLARGTAGDITTHLLQLGIDKLKSAININDSELEKAKSGDESAKKGFAEKCRSAAIDVMQKVLSALEWLLRQLQKIMNFLAGNGFVEGDSSIKKEPKPLPEGGLNMQRYEAVENGILNNDIKGLREAVGTLCYTSRDFSSGEFDEVVAYVEKRGIKLKDDKLEGELVSEGKTTYTDEDFAYAVFELKNNFCDERIADVKKIGKALYGKPKSAQRPAKR